MAITLVATALLARELTRTSLDAVQLRTAFAMLAGGMVSVLAAPFYPLAGPTAYAVLSYTFPREHAVTVSLMAIGTMSWLTALSVVGTAVWSLRRGGTVLLPRGRLPWLVAMFGAWVALSIVAAVVNGRPLQPGLLWRGERYLHAVALFFVVAACAPRLRDVRILMLVLSSALIVRQVWLTSVLFNEHNLAMLTVISVPLALAMAFCRPFSILQAPLVLIGAYMTAVVLLIQNRGAVVGLGAGFVGLWAMAHGRRRRWLIPIVIAIAGTTVLWAARSGLLVRFTEIYADGRFLGTAAERIEKWSGGLRLARDYWLFGVGPGNSSDFLARYRTGGGTDPDNGLVEVMTEMGLPGLALYLSMFGVAIRQLVTIARQAASGWHRNLAGGLLRTIAAHLVTGSFLSNPSLVWSWTLLGLAAAPLDVPPRPESTVQPATVER